MKNVERLFGAIFASGISLVDKDYIEQIIIDEGFEGDDLNSTVYNGKNIPALVYATMFRANPEVVELLIRYGADVNRPGSFGDAPMHWTSTMFGNKTDVITLLLQHGANPDITNIDGDTPLTLAAFYQNSETVNLLLSLKDQESGMHLVDVNHRNHKGITLYERHSKSTKNLISLAAHGFNLECVLSQEERTSSIEVQIGNASQAAHAQRKDESLQHQSKAEAEEAKVQNTTYHMSSALHDRLIARNPELHDPTRVYDINSELHSHLSLLVRLERTGALPGYQLNWFGTELTFSAQFIEAIAHQEQGLIKAKFTTDYRYKSDQEKGALKLRMTGGLLTCAADLLELAFQHRNHTTLATGDAQFSVISAGLALEIARSGTALELLLRLLTEWADSRTTYNAESANCSTGVITKSLSSLEGMPGYDDIYIGPKMKEGEFDPNDTGSLLYLRNKVIDERVLFESLPMGAKQGLVEFCVASTPIQPRILSEIHGKVAIALEELGFGIEKIGVPATIAIQRLLATPTSLAEHMFRDIEKFVMSHCHESESAPVALLALSAADNDEEVDLAGAEVHSDHEQEG